MECVTKTGKLGKLTLFAREAGKLPFLQPAPKCTVQVRHMHPRRSGRGANACREIQPLWRQDNADASGADTRGARRNGQMAEGCQQTKQLPIQHETADR